MPFGTPTTPGYFYQTANATFTVNIAHSNGTTALVYMTLPEDEFGIPAPVNDAQEVVQAVVDALDADSNITVVSAQAFMSSGQVVTVTP